ncbi:MULTISPECIES: sodium-dependent transporter [Lysinibacillus]|uniref:Sodium-dependent transporter n=1 Tax=Lysinibacillus antri TaxID=2498145 RepID=A0A432LA90_9BACI|nr:MULTISPECIES: sodium-dependent transporter [Lysinibacillus]RUL51273.1 sodium-dependent transporter [Lysinibacillus antri]TSI05158.1 sodium-dependent transporter [Lysinibacillus sp. BW-2-10]
MEQNQQWSSKIGFILASAGSAIGLGAIWKLPYVTGTSGGGAFILLFVLFSLLIGFPLLLAEFVIGRKTQKDAIAAYKHLAPNTKWYYIGYLGVFTCFVLLSFYSVIGGWIVQYIFYSVTGQVGTGNADYEALFNHAVSNPALAIGGQALFLIVTAFVVGKGIQAGIEKASKFMMPALFVLFIVLIVRSLTLDNAMEGVSFFLMPDFSKLNSESILFALGQSFFLLSVGVSVMVTYSSYLKRDDNIIQPSISIVGMNLFISIFAGLAIFPAVFSLGFEPTAGPGLLFIVLPSVFEQMVFGQFFLLMFLVLFLFATLTSAFSLLEIVVAVGSKNNNNRNRQAWIMGIFVFILGVPSALSFGIWSDVSIFGKSIFDAADYLVSNILLPLGAFLISIFVSYKLKKDILKSELIRGTKVNFLFEAWYFLLRYIIPLVIIIVFLDVTDII